MINFMNFSKRYKKSKIIEPCTFEIKPNKINFFMGPNGVGKTTLIKCLAGLEKYNGVITYEKNNIDLIRRKMLVIWDDCPFYENMSGIKNLMIMSEDRDISENEIISLGNKYFTKELLRRKVKTYSYGQKKKLALVLQMVLDPKIVVMDEISNGLDYDTMQELKRDITELSKNKTVILTGHQFSFYEKIVDNVFIIKDGCIKDVSNEYLENDFSLENIYERHFKNEKSEK